MNQRGPALVRIAIFSLVFGAIALALVQPSMAGTPDSPEVQDAAGDVQVTPGTIPTVSPITSNPNYDGIDIIKGYVQANNTTVTIVLQMNGATNNAAGTKYNATFTIVTGGNETNRSVQRLADAVTGPAGVAAKSSGKFINFTVPTSSLGVMTGSQLANLKVTTAMTGSTIPVVTQVTQDNQQASDTAGPSTIPFVFNGPSPDDVDSDGIPDACELQYFNGTAAQNNASADPDGDGLTIGEECALGTDPTKADTDGDGTNDKDDPFPTDATKGGKASSGSGSGSGSKTGTGSGSGSKTGSGSDSGSNTGGDGNGDVKNLGDAVERLKSDLDYLGISAGGMVAVLILSILALAVRWSL